MPTMYINFHAQVTMQTVQNLMAAISHKWRDHAVSRVSVADWELSRGWSYSPTSRMCTETNCS